jgi:hypothetical protein
LKQLKIHSVPPRKETGFLFSVFSSDKLTAIPRLGVQELETLKIRIASTAIQVVEIGTLCQIKACFESKIEI